jgi:hypothetical protein
MLFTILTFVSAGAADQATGVDPKPEPTLSLPDLEPDEIVIPNWSSDRSLSNSGRAWHYLPPMVRPLLELSQALEETVLPRSTCLLLAAVVASRNHCLY